MTNMLDRLIAAVAPRAGLRRARYRQAAEVLAHYDAATTGRRSGSWRPGAGSADVAAARRDRLAWVSRDMVRNTPLAARAAQVITNNVVGEGIIPKVEGGSERLRARALELIEAHLDTVAIDARGVLNLYGLQRQAMGAVVESGEVLVRRRRRLPGDGLPLPFQIQVLEPDHLDATKDGVTAAGNVISEGIEYDAIGRRVAYHIYRQHPGSRMFGGYYRMESSRVPAADVAHVFLPSRPEQMRGVAWLAPVALRLQDLADHQDAQLMRQKIAACFAAFRVQLDGEGTAAAATAQEDTLRPGIIETLAPGEDIKFGAPPGVTGFDEFEKSVLRECAAGLGITYEALTGDLSQVNFSSARMGRMEMDRNVQAWQWLMLIPQMMDPVARWFLEALRIGGGMTDRQVDGLRLRWTPPRRVLVDPTKEIPALREAVRAGFDSRQNVQRSLGFDPERLNAEIAEDNATADEHGFAFTSDARQAAEAESPPPDAADDAPDDAPDDEGQGKQTEETGE